MQKRRHNKAYSVIASVVVITVILALQSFKLNDPKYSAELEPLSKSTALLSNYNVVDGDTLRYGNERIRIWGIDAPELHQTCLHDAQLVACGQQAKQFLVQIFTENSHISCRIQAVDRYKRHVSQCMVNNQDVGALMVKAGWAVDYTQYSHGTYKKLELQAQKSKDGMWQYIFDQPADWRRGIRRIK